MLPDTPFAHVCTHQHDQIYISHLNIQHLYTDILLTHNLYREKEVEIEKKLRKQAEDKLQSCLQNMYANQEVNQELRQRLPRANKSDPFKQDLAEQSESDISEIEEQIISEEETSKSSR